MAGFRQEIPTFAGGEVGPELQARSDVAKYRTALKRARNVFVQRSGGVTRRPGLLHVCEVADTVNPAKLVEFQFSTQQSYALLFGHLSFRVIKEGAPVSETAKPIGAVAAGPLTFTVNAHGYNDGDEVFFEGLGGLADADGLSGVNGRTFKVANKTANTFRLQTLQGAAFTGAGLSAWTAGGTVERIYKIASPYLGTELADLGWEQSADVVYLAHLDHAPGKLSRTGHAAWAFADLTFGPKIKTVGGIGSTTNWVSNNNPTWHYYVVTAVADDGDESEMSASTSEFADLNVVGTIVTVTWTHAPDAAKPKPAVRFNVYKRSAPSAEAWGYIGSTEDTTFVDNNIAPDYGDTPPETKNPFLAAGDRPRRVTFFEQRLVWAHTRNRPNAVYASQSANFENMNYSLPAKAEDALSFAVLGRRVNAIQALVPMDELLALTSDAAFRITGGGVTDYLTPSSIVVRPQFFRPADALRPLVIDDEVFMVEEGGQAVRTIGYSIEADGYRGSDVTVFAPHLFAGKEVVAWGWARRPHGLIVCALSDGTLACLTWMREQEVWGWTRCETDGLVKDVCVVAEPTEDAVYVIVDRTIGGVARRFVERLAPRWGDAAELADGCWLDAAVKYEGAPASVIGGLDHLEGRSVDALADGMVVSDLTVTGGKIRLPGQAAKVWVGLRYRSLIETLPQPAQTERGSSVGRRQSVGAAVLRLIRTLGVKVGVRETDLLEVKLPRPAVGQPREPYTGDLEANLPAQWSTGGTVVVVQDKPLPMTVIGIYPDLKVEN